MAVFSYQKLSIFFLKFLVYIISSNLRPFSLLSLYMTFNSNSYFVSLYERLKILRRPIFLSKNIHIEKEGNIFLASFA